MTDPSTKSTTPEVFDGPSPAPTSPELCIITAVVLGSRQTPFQHKEPLDGGIGTEAPMLDPGEVRGSATVYEQSLESKAGLGNTSIEADGLENAHTPEDLVKRHNDQARGMLEDILSVQSDLTRGLSPTEIKQLLTKLTRRFAESDHLEDELDYKVELVGKVRIFLESPKFSLQSVAHTHGSTGVVLRDSIVRNLKVGLDKPDNLSDLAAQNTSSERTQSLLRLLQIRGSGHPIQSLDGISIDRTAPAVMMTMLGGLFSQRDIEILMGLTDKTTIPVDVATTELEEAKSKFRTIYSFVTESTNVPYYCKPKLEEQVVALRVFKEGIDPEEMDVILKSVHKEDLVYRRIFSLYRSTFAAFIKYYDALT